MVTAVHISCDLFLACGQSKKWYVEPWLYMLLESWSQPTMSIKPENFLCHLSQNFSQCVKIPCHHISSSCSTGDHITSWLVSKELWKLVGDFLYSLMRSGENLQMFKTNLSSATHQDRDTKQQVFSIIAFIEVPNYSTGLNESEKQNFIDPIHLVIWPSYLPANLLDLHKSSGFLKTLGIFPRIICRHDFHQFEVRYVETEPRHR